MPTTYKVLGQTAAAADTDTTLYTVPALVETVVSTINICNRGGSAATFRIAIRPNGEALAAKHYISYDTTVPANDSIALTLGITLKATDIITTRANSDNVTFNAFGTEMS